VDLAAFARSLGATAVAVADAADLDSAIRELLSHSGPRVMVVHTDPDILTPTATLSGLLGDR